MKRVGWWLALVLIAGGCSGDSADVDASAPVPGGNAAAFCARWPEARSTILADLEVEHESLYKQAVAVVRDTLDEVDLLVPPEIRPLWETARAYKSTVVHLVDIAGSPDAIRPELIQAAFPGGDFAATEQSALTAVAAIDQWSIDQCGDFCELWPRLDRALAWNLAFEHGGVDWPLLVANGRDEAALLSLADSLVPSEIRGVWSAVAGVKTDLVALMIETLDVDDPGDGSEFAQRVGELVDPGHLWEQLIRPATDEGFEEAADRLGVEPWQLGGDIEEMVRAPLRSWVEENCETVGGSGLPGAITVHTSESGARAEGTLLVVALPLGTDIRTTGSARDFLGALCFEAYPSDHGPRSRFLLDREADFQQPCAWLEGWDHGGARQAVLDAGQYDLFFGLFTRGIGAYDGYLAAPETCATVSVIVDGDVDIDVPPLEACEMQYLAGTPDEYARRNPPPPGEPTGTLRLEVTDFRSPGEEGQFIHGGQLRAAVVLAGTSLNDVGRGDVWPAGVGCLGLPPGDQWREILDELEGRLGEIDRLDEDAARADRNAAEQQTQADRAREQAEQTRQQAEQLWAEADRLDQEADAVGEDAERDRLREEANQRRAEGDEAWGEFAWLQEEADRLQGHADETRAEADRIREDADRVREDADRLLQQRETFEDGVEFVVSVFPVAPEDFGRVCPAVFELIDGAESFADPVALAFGSYDVLLEQVWHGDEEEWIACAGLTVEIDGDVVVRVPEMGECP